EPYPGGVTTIRPPTPSTSLAGVKNLHGRFHFATVRRPRPLLRRQLPDRNSCGLDRSDAAGAGPPLGAPGRGLRPPVPRGGGRSRLSPFGCPHPSKTPVPPVTMGIHGAHRPPRTGAP